MKIASADVFLVLGGKLHPVLVRLTTSDGVVGIGEAAIAYGVGGTAAAGMLKDLCERFVIGQDATRIEALWSEMYDHSFWAKGGGPIVFAGISAIETALWDIRGRVLGVPVYELFGGRMRDTVRVYANGWYGSAHTPRDFAKAAERPLADGYTALKCYPLAVPFGAGLRHVSRRTVDRAAADLAYARVKALRDAAGPAVEIMLDLSGALTTDETVRLCRRFEEFDITWIEEPADPFDVEATREVARRVNIPVAAGERLYTRHGFRATMEARAVHIVQPDPGNTGGLMETKKIAAMAEVFNMRVAPHNCASALSTAMSLQIAACIPNFMIQEIYPYFPETPGYVQVLRESPEAAIRAGVVAVPEGPGLGVTLADDRVAPHLFARCVA